MRIEHGDHAGSRAETARTVELELAPGECVRIGDRLCTVVEVEPGEVHLRIDRAVPAAAEASFARRAAALPAFAR